ncbi:hypothetical protein KKE14_00715 [Patescibacteria group bacterium]|nr:hypothetical protein [Patescibacteria group bacterium]
MRDVFQKNRWLIPALIATLAITLGVNSDNPDSQIKGDMVSALGINAELGPDQPTKFLNTTSSRVGQFTVSTDYTGPIGVTALQFDSMGSLRSKIIKRYNLALLSIEVGGVVIGNGEVWEYNYGRLQQTVELETPIIVDKNNPVTFEVYANLVNQSGSTFGIVLSGLENSQIFEEVSVVGPHRVITSN